MKTGFLFILVLLLPFVSSGDTIECTKLVFMETIDEMTEFTNSQLDTLDNLSPNTKKKLKIAILDVLNSLGLLLEMSVAPSFSMTTLPIYILRAQNLMTLLSKDMENMQPESESISDSLEVFKKRLTSVVNEIPMKAMRCFQ